MCHAASDAGLMDKSMCTDVLCAAVFGWTGCFCCTVTARWLIVVLKHTYIRNIPFLHVTHSLCVQHCSLASPTARVQN